MPDDAVGVEDENGTAGGPDSRHPVAFDEQVVSCGDVTVDVGEQREGAVQPPEKRVGRVRAVPDDAGDDDAVAVGPAGPLVAAPLIPRDRREDESAEDDDRAAVAESVGERRRPERPAVAQQRLERRGGVANHRWRCHAGTSGRRGLIPTLPDAGLLRPAATALRMSLTLYRLEGCPFCEFVVDELEELGVDYDSVWVEGPHSEREEVRAVSGQRQVPVVVDEEYGVVMSQSARILEFLAATYGDEVADPETA